jgi:hypothetical protein
LCEAIVAVALHFSIRVGYGHVVKIAAYDDRETQKSL